MREVEFEGYWEGDVLYSCDCPGCTKHIRIPFASEDEEKDVEGQMKDLRDKFGWRFTRVNGSPYDFCSEKCRNNFVRDNTN